MKEIIQKMQKDGSEIKKINQSVYCLKVEMDGQKPVYCVYDSKRDQIGKGAFGIVYKASVYNPSSGLPYPNRFIVIKKIINLDDFNEEKYSIASKYIPTGKIINFEGTFFIPQQFFSGSPIQGDNFITHPYIAKLTPGQLLTFIINLLERFNDLHHFRLVSGDSVGHFDIKGSNILVDFIPDSKDPSRLHILVQMIDFDLAAILDSSNSQEMVLLPFSYDTSYHPEEAKREESGIKSDIYQLAGIIALILGFKQFGEEAIYQKRFSQQQLTALPKFGFDDLTKQALIDFINKMRNKDYDSRPNTDEPLKFFMKLKRLQKFMVVSPVTEHIQDSINAIKAELILLADGHWHQLSFEKNDDSIEKLRNLGVPEITLNKIIPLLDPPIDLEEKMTIIVTPPTTSSQDEKPILNKVSGGSSLFSTTTSSEEKFATKSSQDSSERLFYVVTLSGKTIEDTWRLLEKSMKNPSFALLGVPPTILHTDLAKARDQIGKAPNQQIIAFKYPSNSVPGPQHIKKENLVIPSQSKINRSDFTAS